MKRARTLRELARGVGRTPQAVHVWTRRVDWNQGRRGPWDIDKARRWAAATLEADRNPEQHAGAAAPAAGRDPFEEIRRNPMQQAKLRREIANAGLAEARRSMITGEWVPREEAEAALVLRITRFKADLLPLGAALAARWGEIDCAETLQQITDTLVERILAEYARGKLCEHIKRPRLAGEADADAAAEREADA